jgi:hypothetical protein
VDAVLLASELTFKVRSFAVKVNCDTRGAAVAAAPAAATVTVEFEMNFSRFLKKCCSAVGLANHTVITVWKNAGTTQVNCTNHQYTGY